MIKLIGLFVIQNDCTPIKAHNRSIFVSLPCSNRITPPPVTRSSNCSNRCNYQPASFSFQTRVEYTGWEPLLFCLRLPETERGQRSSIDFLKTIIPKKYRRDSKKFVGNYITLGEEVVKYLMGYRRAVSWLMEILEKLHNSSKNRQGINPDFNEKFPPLDPFSPIIRGYLKHRHLHGQIHRCGRKGAHVARKCLWIDGTRPTSTMKSWHVYRVYGDFKNGCV